jgi:hypothetical protein
MCRCPRCSVATAAPTSKRLLYLIIAAPQSAATSVVVRRWAATATERQSDRCIAPRAILERTRQWTRISRVQHRCVRSPLTRIVAFSPRTKILPTAIVFERRAEV